MTRLVACLAVLPKIRQGLMTLVLVSSVFDLIASLVLLAYQLSLTVSFQHVVPSIVVTSFLGTCLPVWFLYSRPYAIRLPGKGDPAVGSKRDKVAKFSRSIAAELICLCGTGVWVLISVSTLHAECVPPPLRHLTGLPSLSCEADPASAYSLLQDARLDVPLRWLRHLQDAPLRLCPHVRPTLALPPARSSC